MGYTHYYERSNTAVDPERFRIVAQDARAMYEVIRNEISIGDGSGDALDDPLFDDEAICFNGVGDDSHEEFYFAVNGEKFDFCKTAQKPYDTLVVGVLLSVKQHLPEIHVSSDGDHSDHQAGIDLYEKATGRKAIPI